MSGDLIRLAARAALEQEIVPGSVWTNRHLLNALRGLRVNATVIAVEPDRIKVRHASGDEAWTTRDSFLAVYVPDAGPTDPMDVTP